MLSIKFLKRLIAFSMFIMLIQILIGLKVREFIDIKIDLYGFENKNLWLSNPWRHKFFKWKNYLFARLPLVQQVRINFLHKCF